MNDNDWFFDKFSAPEKHRTEGQALVVMAVLWAFIIAGVVCSITLALNLSEFGL